MKVSKINQSNFSIKT